MENVIIFMENVLIFMENVLIFMENILIFMEMFSMFIENVSVICDFFTNFFYYFSFSVVNKINHSRVKFSFLQFVR